MSEDLLTGGFCWVSEEKIDFTKKSISWVSFDEIVLTKKSITWDSTEKSNKGLILEVDLDYPKHLLINTTTIH